MKLAAKLVTIIVLGIIAFLTIDGYFTVRRDIESFETDMKRNAHLLGRAMKGSVTKVWLLSGRQDALKLISEVNESAQVLYVRWVSLAAQPDGPHSPRVARKKLDRVIQGQETSFEERNKDGAGYLYTYVPLQVGPDRSGALELSQSLSGLDAYTRKAVNRILVLTATLLFLSVVAILLLGFGMIGRPLHRLIEKIRRIGAGDLSGPLYLRGGAEFSELATALNAMCKQLDDTQKKIRKETTARITAIEQLRHADRLKTIGALASGIAHELGTPLNVVSGRAGLIATGELSHAEASESAVIIKTQSERMTAIIRQLLNFARRQSPKKAIVDLRQIVIQTITLMAPLAQKQKAGLCFAGQDVAAMARVDAGQIQQVLTNLIVNALQAMPQEGRVEVGIRCEQTRPPEGDGDSAEDYLCIDVRDSGVGIPEENIQRLFEPFFTTKKTGKGTGLGLSIAYGIIQEHGGWIGVKSAPGAGSCFSVYLPREVEA